MDVSFWLLLPILAGTVAMAGIVLSTRFILNLSIEFVSGGINLHGKPVSSLQFLIASHGLTTILFGATYLATWGFTMPSVLDGFWKAVLCGTAANVIIQFLNATASSFDEGEVSLSKPIQSMTPGLITVVGFWFGEWPGLIGYLGISSMMIGTYVLFAKPGVPLWIPFKGIYQSALVFKAKWSGREYSQVEFNTALVILISLGSACMGTVGLVFDGRFTRLGVNMQGLTLGAMTFTAGFTLVYGLWYLIAPDAKNELQKKVGFRLFLKPKYALVLLIAAISWELHVLLINPTYHETLIAFTGSLKRLSIPLIVILGFLILGEKEFPKRFKASIFIALGAILISRDDFMRRTTRRIERLL